MSAGWTPTKPRAPIAAMYNSPGPQYMLPGLVGQKTHDPRSVHYRGPAYPFGIRHGKFRDDSSPGPAYLLDSKIYRDGKDGTPQYSLYSRPRDMTSFKTPGPGTYSPEVSGPTAKYRAPQYSFGARLRQRQTDDTPAPNRYSLPNMVGKTVQAGKPQAPAYSLRGRNQIGSFHEDLSKTPGPAGYNVSDLGNTKERAPVYSMTSRNIMPGDATQKPGPGSHSPERVWVNKRQMPFFSFGIRHSPYCAPLIAEVKE